MKDRSPQYAENTVSLSDCGVSADISALKRMIVEAFGSHMAVDTSVSFLSQEEQRMSQELSLKKYTSDRWNLQGDGE
jgi:lipoate-protein ligase A